MVSTIKLSCDINMCEFIKSMMLMNQEYDVEIEGFDKIVITTDDKNRKIIIKSADAKRKSKRELTNHQIGFRKE